ncbi:MAG TPA: hypothetical protein VLA00_07105 [Xanthobacteraceae bacterium]|nr:hypothetical protein [Xanthobacteraceae bacterium]
MSPEASQAAMAPAEPAVTAATGWRGPGRTVLACMAFAFLSVAVLSGAAAFLLVAHFEREVQDGARRELGIIGASVARSLAQQYDKAVRYGIPLEALPGIGEHLAATLDAADGLTRIALIGADGRRLGVAERNAADGDTAVAAIEANGTAVARIEVVTSPAALTGAFDAFRLTAVAAVAAASLAAALAGLFVGRHLARREAAFADTLTLLATTRFAAPVPALPSHGPVALAFHRFEDAQRALRERRLAFDAYADELLAVDFDERQRPEIAGIRAELGLERLAPAPGAEAE